MNLCNAVEEIKENAPCQRMRILKVNFVAYFEKWKRRCILKEINCTSDFRFNFERMKENEDKCSILYQA